MKIELNPNEFEIKQGGASLQENIETVGGKLRLTNQRLIFKSHKINIQTGITEIQLTDIESVKKCWTKFLGFIPLMPNSLAINTVDGKAFSFVLFGQSSWISAVLEQKKCL